MATFPGARPAIRVKLMPQYPVRHESDGGIKVTTQNGTNTYSLDYESLIEDENPNAGRYRIAGYDPETGEFRRVRMDQLELGPIDIADVTDASDVGQAVVKAADGAAARTAIGAASSSDLNGRAEADLGNVDPETGRAALGIPDGAEPNRARSSEVQAKEATDNTTDMSPERVRQQVSVLLGGDPIEEPGFPRAALIDRGNTPEFHGARRAVGVDRRAQTTAAFQAAMNYARTKGTEFEQIEGGNWEVDELVTYTSASFKGTLVAQNETVDGSGKTRDRVLRALPLPADITYIANKGSTQYDTAEIAAGRPIVNIPGWLNNGDFLEFVGKDKEPLLAAYYGCTVTVITGHQGFVERTGDGNIAFRDVMTIVDPDGSLSIPVTRPKIAPWNVSLRMVAIKNRRPIVINEPRIVFASGSTPRVGAVSIERPDVQVIGGLLDNQTGTYVPFLFNVADASNVTVVGMRASGCRERDPNAPSQQEYAYAIDRAMNVSFVNCSQEYARRGLDAHGGKLISVEGGSYPDGIGGHWVEGLRATRAKLASDVPNTCPVHVAGRDVTIDDCDITVRGDQAFVANIRQDMFEWDGAARVINSRITFDCTPNLYAASRRAIFNANAEISVIMLANAASPVTGATMQWDKTGPSWSWTTQGAFGGATATLQSSPDGSAWTSIATSTAPETKLVNIPVGTKFLRTNLAGATGGSISSTVSHDWGRMVHLPKLIQITGNEITLRATPAELAAFSGGFSWVTMLESNFDPPQGVYGGGEIILGDNAFNSDVPITPSVVLAKRNCWSSGGYRISLNGKTANVRLVCSATHPNPTAARHDVDIDVTGHLVWSANYGSFRRADLVADSIAPGRPTGYATRLGDERESMTIGGVRIFDAGGSGAALGKATGPLVQFKGDSATTTGAIVFTMPAAVGGAQGVMMMAALKGMLHNSAILDLGVRGYVNSNAWTASAFVHRGSGAAPQVRLGIGPGSRPCIILGDVGTSWSFPHIAIVNALLSHNSATDVMATGWTASLVTDLSAYSGLVSPANQS